MGVILIKSQIWSLGTLNEFGEGEVDALRLSYCKLGPRGHYGKVMGSGEVFTLHSLFTFINLLSFFLFSMSLPWNSDYSKYIQQGWGVEGLEF